MKIIIWGTGKIARHYMYTEFDEMMKNDIEIIGFTDNNDKMWGDLFFGYDIYDPETALRSEYDYIVMLNGFEKDITAQLINLYGEKIENKILSASEFFQQIMIDTGFWSKRNVLFVGDKAGFVFVMDRSQYTFKSYSYVENIAHIQGIDDYDYILICPPRLISEEDRIKYEDKIENEILSRYSIKCEKILHTDIWLDYLMCDRKIPGGNKNEKKSFYIITVPDTIAGWGYILLNFMGDITYARKKGYIPIVDMKYMQNQYLSSEKLGRHNAWTDFYEQLTDYSLEEVYQSKNVYMCGFATHFLDDKNYDDLKLKPEMKEYIDHEQKNFFPEEKGKILGVIYRGTDYAAAYNHQNPLNLERFLNLIAEFLERNGYSFIFLATEIQEVISIFEEHFKGRVYYTDQKRYPASEHRLLSTLHFKRENDAFCKGQEYLTVLELLSRCDALIGSCCSATQVVQVMNGGKYEYYKLLEEV